MGLFFVGLVFVALCVAAWPFTIDDAFIVARFGRQLRDGTYGYNPGEVTDGITGPLWVLPAWWAASAGWDIPATLKGTGVLFFGAALYITWRGAGQRAQGGRLIAAAVMALSSSAALWAVGGLETAFATCLMAVLASASWTRRASRWPALALLLLPAVRPDLVPAACVLAATGPHPRRVFAAGALGLLAVVAFRLLLFDTLLPLSLAAKGSSFANGLGYVALGSVFLFLPALPWVLIAVFTRLRRSQALTIALISHLTAVAVVGGDWMPGHRLLIPMLPVVGLLAAAGFMKLKRERPHLSLVVTGLALATAVGLIAVVLPAGRASGSYRETAGQTLVDTLSEQQGPIALIDIGWVGFASGLTIIDLAGITDPEVARMAGSHVDRHIDIAYLDVRAPHQIVLHSSTQPQVDEQGRIQEMTGYPTENRLAAHEWVRTHFSVSHVLPYAPGYWYLVLRRRPESQTQ